LNQQNELSFIETTEFFFRGSFLVSSVSETVMPLVNYLSVIQLCNEFGFQLFFNRFLIDFKLTLNYDGEFEAINWRSKKNEK
jgi:hypothetical protein